MRILHLLPEVEGEEMLYIQNLVEEMSDENARAFANVYRARRKDPQTVLLMTIVGLFVVPGLERFYLNQIGMGILYLLTIGLCFVGTIVDIINYKKLTLEYNMKVAREALAAIMGTGVV